MCQARNGFPAATRSPRSPRSAAKMSPLKPRLSHPAGSETPSNLYINILKGGRIKGPWGRLEVMAVRYPKRSPKSRPDDRIFHFPVRKLRRLSTACLGQVVYLIAGLPNFSKQGSTQCATMFRKRYQSMRIPRQKRMHSVPI